MMRRLPRPFLRTSDVAGYLNVKNSTVLSWITRGKLKAFKTPGGHWRVLHEEFLAFLKRYEIPACIGSPKPELQGRSDDA